MSRRIFLKIICVHFCLSLSIVPVKEASIVIAISSNHRKESLEAVHYVIDTVKAVVPVWKKVIIICLFKFKFRAAFDYFKKNKNFYLSLKSFSRLNEKDKISSQC